MIGTTDPAFVQFPIAGNNRVEGVSGFWFLIGHAVGRRYINNFKLTIRAIKQTYEAVSLVRFKYDCGILSHALPCCNFPN